MSSDLECLFKLGHIFQRVRTAVMQVSYYSHFQVFLSPQVILFKKETESQFNADISSRLWGGADGLFHPLGLLVSPSFYFLIHTGKPLAPQAPDHCSLHLDSKHGVTTVADTPGPAAWTEPLWAFLGFKRKVNTDAAGEQQEDQVY